MPIDNSWYEKLGDKWWDESGPVGPLHDMNPARFGYFESVLGRLEGLEVLDLGCGGGILAESFARAGARVTGLDLSRSSLIAARRHSNEGGLAIEFACARGESLPFLDNSFDAVASADFLEHVSDLDGVVGECARVLKPMGLFLYDTINRTIRSRVVTVWLFERVLGVIPRNTHDPDMFVKPGELHELMSRYGLSHRETLGLSPQAGPIGALISLLKKGRPGPFKITEDTSISYVGYGIKNRLG